MSRSIEVVFSGRQTGKTQYIVESAYEDVKAGLTVAIFCPTIQQVRDITTRWQRAHPTQPVPYAKNLLAIHGRGRIFDRVYIDNIDHVEDGIYDEHVLNLLISVSQNDGKMVVTCSPTPWSYKSHNTYVESVSERYKRYKARKDQNDQDLLLALELANKTGVSLKDAMRAIRAARIVDPEATSE